MSQYLLPEEIAALGLRSFGAGVLIHRTANLVAPGNISIGSSARIDAFTTIVASGEIEIGDYTHIGGQCFIGAAAGFRMGDFSTLSHGCKVFTVSDDYSGASLTNPMVPEEFKTLDKAAVTLGRHVIVGANSVIMPGANLSEGVAIGALSFVRGGTLDAWTIYAGAPVRSVAARKKDALRLEQEFLNKARETGGDR